MACKNCTRCGNEFPATIEYFRKCERGKMGFYSWCRVCERQNYLNNIEHAKEKARKSWVKNAERYKERKKLWRHENNEKARIYKIEYRRQNPEITRLCKQRRRAKKNELQNNFTADAWEYAKQFFNNKCAYCGKEALLEQDHFIPLSKGGEYTNNNIIPACKSCNGKKHDKNFFEWYPKYEHYSKRREQKILKYLNYSKTGLQQLSLL